MIGFGSDRRIGDWCQTATGRQFWPLDPRPEEVFIDDIAHALSNVCRFGGHCRTFYSVAQHSYLVSKTCFAIDAMAGLLHDSQESFVGDMVRPLKHTDEMRTYRDAEERVRLAIFQRFGLPSAIPDSVKRADEVLLATEARDVMGGECAGKWFLRAKPLPEIIIPWDPITAKRAFLDRFYELGGKR